MQGTIEKLGDRLINIAVQAVVYVLETGEAHHIKVVVKGPLRVAIKEKLVTALDGLTSTKKPFENAII